MIQDAPPVEEKAPMAEAERTAAGAVLTERITHALYPVITGEPTSLVIEALANAFWSALVLVTPTAADRAWLIRRYAKAMLEHNHRYDDASGE